MGLILDSSILIAAERQGHSARRLLIQISDHIGTEDVEAGICVLTLMELTHGAVRADSAERKSMRQRFIQELISAVSVYPITNAVAIRAGEVDGERQANGVKIPLADLLIGVVALELGYDVLTKNPRRFSLIPGLKVVSF